MLALILSFSCTSRTIYKKPKNLVPEEQMVELWVDIMIANGARSKKNKKAQGKINYMPFVFKKYNIDSTRFMESNIYYTSKIEQYEKMFQEVEARLKKIKEIYDPLSKDIDPELPIWKRDSIRKSRKEVLDEGLVLKKLKK